MDNVEGTWKELTETVNLLANNLTTQVREIASVTQAVAKGDFTRKVTANVSGEIKDLKSTINTMVDKLNSFALRSAKSLAKSAQMAPWVVRRTSTELKANGLSSQPMLIPWRTI